MLSQPIRGFLTRRRGLSRAGGRPRRQISDTRPAESAGLVAAANARQLDPPVGLGFRHSQQMSLVRNNQGHGIYRMIFISRHSFPKGIWDDVARDHRRTLDMFDR
jgi:hypothetical protein